MRIGRVGIIDIIHFGEYDYDLYAAYSTVVIAARTCICLAAAPGR